VFKRSRLSDAPYCGRHILASQFHNEHAALTESSRTVMSVTNISELLSHAATKHVPGVPTNSERTSKPCKCGATFSVNWFFNFFC